MTLLARFLGLSGSAPCELVGMYLDGYYLGYGVQVCYVGYFDYFVVMVYSDDVAFAGFDLQGVANDFRLMLVPLRYFK